MNSLEDWSLGIIYTTNNVQIFENQDRVLPYVGFQRKF